MKKMIILGLILSALCFSSCKKCWDCGEKVDGHSVKTCDKAKVDAIENGQVYTDANGNPIYRQCH